MKRDRSIAPLLVAVVMLIPAVLAGQGYPLTPVFEIAPPHETPFPEELSYSYGPASSAVPVGEGFAVAWSTWESRPTPGESDSFIEGLLVDGEGRPGAGFGTGAGGYSWNPTLVATKQGGFAAIWREGRIYSADLMVDLWSPDARSLLEEPRSVNDPTDDLEGHYGRSLAFDATGRMVVAWMESIASEGFLTFAMTPKLRILSPACQPLTPEITLGSTTTFPQQEDLLSPQVIVDSKGRVLAVWWEQGPAGGPSRLWYGRHFSLDGVPLGERFFVAGSDDRELLLAKRPGGGFVALWTSGARYWYLGRFQPNGVILGAPVVTGEYGPFAPQLAADKHGNIAVLGSSGGEAVVRLFNMRLVRKGDPLRLGLRVGDMAGQSVALALRDDGRLLVAWTDERPGFPRSVLGQLWQVIKAADLCIYSDDRDLYCDRGDGLGLSMHFTLGDGSPGAIPLLGDLNGDGRADPCLYQDGRFACGAGLSGRIAPFGRPGDFVFLADVDGDGRADPCVRRGTRFLCDRARDGGAPDFTAGFGTKADIGVMGDADGDGRDDPCVYRNGLFLCDTAHDGGAAEVRLNLQRVLGDAGLLGQGTPLLGDVNGDGRADPCLWAAGRFVCGIVPQGGRFPAQVIDRRFGTPDGIPLLGDVDAF